MKNKAKRNEYKESAAFLADLELMVANAVLFNGAMSYITVQAKTLHQKAVEQIDVKRGDIEAMECAIKMNLWDHSSSKQTSSK